MDTDQFAHLQWFRNATPYIQQHRQQTFVIALGGDAVQHAQFSQLIRDILLLNSLGIRLVLVHGSRPQINARLAQMNLTPTFQHNRRITDDAALPYVVEACGTVRHHIEAALSMGATQPTQRGAHHNVSVFSGNMLTARPLGVRDGINFGHTGAVRKVNGEAINALLDLGGIVLLSHVGYSPTGEFFNCAWEEIAEATAIACNAHKLIILNESGGVHEQGELIRVLNTQQAEQCLPQLNTADQRILSAALRACQQGVERCHLISYQEPGALIRELFTIEGSGTLLSRNDFEVVRSATIEDVGSILGLIEPLEEQGVLVKRSREHLEAEIDHFIVIERDNIIVGCAALYPFDNIGELACVAVHPEHRHDNRGDALLDAIETRAREQGLTGIFVLTTQTAQWFKERGFTAGDISQLPVKKQALYNLQRNSLVFNKNLNGSEL